MLKIFKKNIKFLKNHYNIAEILNINDQSLANKLSDNKRQFSLIDAILISKELNIPIDELVFKDLSKPE